MSAYNKHITMQMWEEAGSFDKVANPGDTVDEEIVEQFMDCVPPLYYQSAYKQCGEPSNHCKVPGHDRYAPTYVTFRKINGAWVYVGDCFKGKSEHQNDTPPIVSIGNVETNRRSVWTASTTGLNERWTGSDIVCDDE